MIRRKEPKVENKSYYCVIDTETGGLHPAHNPICEISFIILNNKLEEVDRYSAINKNYNDLKYSQEALDIHGISMKEINAGITIQDSLKSVNGILSKYSKGKDKVILVGHNMEYDYKMLKYAFEFCKMDIHKYTIPQYQCTMRMSHMAWGYDDKLMDNFKLSTCCAKIGAPIAESHRGLPDVISTVHLFKYHVMSLRGSVQAIVSSEPQDEFARVKRFNF